MTSEHKVSNFFFSDELVCSCRILIKKVALIIFFVDATAHMSHRNDESTGGDHSHMNGHVELKRSCRARKSQFEHLNQSLLFDQLVNR